MRIFDHPDFAGHEQVVAAGDRETGLRAFIAVHNTARGPALGGCRIWPYASEAEALTDVLRLSRGMTYKGAMADLPFGGGKMVVIANPDSGKTPQLLHSIGIAIERLRGRYITGEDVGTTADDMAQIARATGKIFGLPVTMGGSGDPSGSTAFGCYVGIKACVAYSLGGDGLSGLKVAVQGLGNVGWRLCELLSEAGAELVVADVRRNLAAWAVERFGARAVAPEEIHAADVEVFAPCALGGVLSDETLPRLKATIVAGAANNQLARPGVATALREQGILYAPDYVINAGGMIQLAGEHCRYEAGELERRLRAIGDTLCQVFDLSTEQGISTEEAAVQLAEWRIARDVSRPIAC